MNVRTFSVTRIEDLQEELEHQSDHFPATLAIGFGDCRFPLEEAISLFRRYNIALVGCSSAGEICDDRMLSNTLSIMLLDIDPDAFKTAYVPGEHTDHRGMGEKVGLLAKKTFANPAVLVYMAGIGVDGAGVVDGIQTVLGTDLPLLGGMAADDFQFEKILAFYEGGLYDHGISVLIFDTDQIQIEGHSYSGWNELGMTHVITKCTDNVLFEVDNKPALDLFTRYFRDLEFRKVEGSEDLFTIPGVFALSVKRPDGTNFMRSTLLFDFENRALVLAGGIEEGDSFKFCPTPSFDVIEATVDKFRSRFDGLAKPEAVLMTSCAARYVAFGPMLEDEIIGIRQILEAPMVGLMAYGEIGRRTGDHEYAFHNVTCSLATLSSKS